MRNVPEQFSFMEYVTNNIKLFLYEPLQENKNH